MTLFDNEKSKEIIKVFPYVKDKMVIDLVNGIHVAENQNQYAKQRNHVLLSRAMDALSGAAASRQAEINDPLIQGVKTCHALINELEKDITQHGAALLQVFERIDEVIESNVTTLADELCHVKDILQQHSGELNALKKDLQHLQDDHNAIVQLESLMAMWSAGGLNELAPLSRAYAVLDALRWGDFGKFMRYGKQEHIQAYQKKHFQEYQKRLLNELIAQLSEDLQSESDQPVMRKDWLRLPDNSNQDLQQILAYQGSACWQDPKRNAYTFTATQWRTLPPEEQEQFELIPFAIQTPKHVAQRLTKEYLAEYQEKK